MDCNVGINIKKQVGETLNHRLLKMKLFKNAWFGLEKVYPASQRHIFMTRLVGEADEEFCAEK